jgi:hypothetical protein
MTAQCRVQDFIWLVTLPVVDIMEHEENWTELNWIQLLLRPSQASMLTWQISLLCLYSCHHQTSTVPLHSPLAKCNSHFKQIPSCMQLQCLHNEYKLRSFEKHNWMIYINPQKLIQEHPCSIFCRCTYLCRVPSNLKHNKRKATFCYNLWAPLTQQEATVWLIPTEFRAILICRLPICFLSRRVTIRVGSVVVDALFRKHHLPELWIRSEVATVDCTLTRLLKHYLQTSDIWHSGFRHATSIAFVPHTARHKHQYNIWATDLILNVYLHS